MSDKITEKAKNISEEMPLVTFALFAYNQEKYIREAVESAFAQTYTPLQIILTDDCSGDRTFEILKQAAEAYNGPHEVILNRNPTNYGLAANVNRVVELADGEIIIAAAGDDISLPQRTSALVATWLAKGKPLAICSRYIRIDESSACYEQCEIEKNYPYWLNDANSDDPEVHRNILIGFLRWELLGLYGATAGWTREIFEHYGALRSDVWYEDRVIFLRAIIEKRIVFHNENLVFYRTHAQSMTNYQYVRPKSYSEVLQVEIRVARRSERRLGHLQQHSQDVLLAYKQKAIDCVTFELLSDELNRQIQLAIARSDWWKSGTLIRLFSLYPKIRRYGENEDVTWARKRLLPLPLFSFIRTLKLYLLNK